VPWRHVARVRELELAPPSKLILYALASRADERGRCWPSVAQICLDTCLKRRAVQVHLKRLIDARLIARDLSSGRTGTLRIFPGEPSLAPKLERPDPRVSCAPPAHVVRTPAHAMRNPRAPRAPEVTNEVPMNHQIPRARIFARRDHFSAPSTEAWWTSQEGVKAKGRELDLPARPGELLGDYKARLFRELKGR
jgi:hypothetical protein